MNNSTAQPIEYDQRKLSKEQPSEWIKSVLELHSQLGMYEVHHALDSIDREHFLSMVRQQKWDVVADLIREAVIEDVEKRAWERAKYKEEVA